MSKVDLYAIGIVFASVCAPKDMTPEEVAAEVNAKHPPGGDLVWFPSTDEKFKTGEPNPCVCSIDPDRLHHLLEC